MAKFKGRGSLSNHNLLVYLPKKRVVPDKETGKIAGYHIDVQLDQSLMNVNGKRFTYTKDGKEFGAQTNPHLIDKRDTVPETDKNGNPYRHAGQTRTRHDQYYKYDDVAKMAQAAGKDNTLIVQRQVVTDAQGNQKPKYIVHTANDMNKIDKSIPVVGYMYGINADLNLGKQGAYVNTRKPMKPTTNHQFNKTAPDGSENVIDRQYAVTHAAQVLKERDYQKQKAMENAPQETIPGVTGLDQSVSQDKQAQNDAFMPGMDDAGNIPAGFKEEVQANNPDPFEGVDMTNSQPEEAEAKKPEAEKPATKTTAKKSETKKTTAKKSTAKKSTEKKTTKKTTTKKPAEKIDLPSSPDAPQEDENNSKELDHGLE